MLLVYVGKSWFARSVHRNLAFGDGCTFQFRCSLCRGFAAGKDSRTSDSLCRIGRELGRGNDYILSGAICKVGVAGEAFRCVGGYTSKAESAK